VPCQGPWCRADRGEEGWREGVQGFIVNVVTQKGRVEERGSVWGGADSARV